MPTVRFFLLALTCCMAMGLATARADELDCSRLPPSSVTVQRLETPVVTNLQYGYRALKGMSADYTRHDLEVLGLTIGQASSRVSVRSSVLAEPGGRWECASHQITLEYGYSPLTVYVSREFPPGSCAYQEIFEHEQKHVRVYLAHARQVEAELTSALKARFEGAPPMRGAVGDSRQRLQREIDERWLPYVRRLLEAAKAEQRAVDSSEEYARVAGSCGGAIRRALAAGGR